MLATPNITPETSLQGWTAHSTQGAPAFPANAPRESGQDSAAARSLPANDGRVQHNPVLDYHRDAQVVLVQFIDPATGEVDKQYPSEKQIEAYQKAMDEQQDSLPELITPKGMGNSPAGDLDVGGKASGVSIPAVNGGPDIDPGQATREVSLVA